MKTRDANPVRVELICKDNANNGRNKKNKKTMNTIQVSTEMIGKYINRYGYSDVNPVGKIIGIKGKTKLIVKKVIASENKTKMQYEVGGFSAICVNQWEQEYDFTFSEEIMEIRISKALMRTVRIENSPRKYYDYNF